MSADATVLLRVQELKRRVEELPREIEAWNKRTENLDAFKPHFSQVRAIGFLMEALQTRQTDRTKVVPAKPDEVGAWALALVTDIIAAQKVWDFFRDKLELRFSPTFAAPLHQADSVAWDCYVSVLQQAVAFQILAEDQLREPPLTYLTAEFSPATWVRGSRPNDGRDHALGLALLPIPVIELPWDHVANPWELLSLHHEVGHDLEADLGLRGPLLTALRDQLIEAKVPPDRVRVWLSWQAEVFADLVGLQLGGPAFADALMHLLLLPREWVVTRDPQDPHPTHYPRILLNAEYARTLGKAVPTGPALPAITAHADQLVARWTEIYGKPPGFDGFIADFPLVFAALMDTKLAVLKDHTVRELMPFTAQHDLDIRAAALALVDPAKVMPVLKPRHIPSAARVAAGRAADAGNALDAALVAIAKAAGDEIKKRAPGELRSSDASRKAFIQGFAANF